jgi:ElaB/YqjD/DUF883 family membrane-anchored ribosome-binding protein
MSQSINELERDIEQTRARLDSTIDQLQSRLSTSGIVDEVLGTVRRTQFASVMDDTLDAIRRNPVPVLLVAAGLGLLFHRMTERSRMARRSPLDPYDDGVPVIRPRGARIYDPDLARAHPASDTMPPRRAHDARA